MLPGFDLSSIQSPGVRQAIAGRLNLIEALTAENRALWDDRIAKTLSKKACFLRVLEYPEVPLHNNREELGARQRVRERDVSFGPRTEGGARA